MNEIMHTEIVGDFLGWRNDTIYMVRDGSCWRPEPGDEMRAFTSNPPARLIMAGDAHYLQVGNASGRRVRRAEAFEDGRWWNDYIDHDQAAASALLNMIQSPMYREAMANTADATI